VVVNPMGWLTLDTRLPGSQAYSLCREAQVAAAVLLRSGLAR
jgi:hypothetical protein